MWLRDLPGVLTAAQLSQTVASIAAAQHDSGALPWPDGHTDPWDHVECAMALVLGGRLDEARAAYDWMRRTQASDGAWCMKYEGEAVLDPSVDTNQVAYVAVGVWQWWQVTGDRSLVDLLWPHVRAALDFVIDYQAPGGHLWWSRDPQGRTDRDALLTGSSSAYQALRCGIALGERLGEPQPEWELAAGLLQHAVAQHPEVFLDKTRFSMDWYYPVLGGAVRGGAARERLADRWEEFVVPGVGCRCVADRPWVTGAETAELALALVADGDRDRALALLSDVQHLREEDGSYWTGLVFDEGVRWPVERSSWTAAAVVLAADALAGGPTLALFRGDGLPTGVLLAADVCTADAAPCGHPVLGGDAPAERRS
ncbi:MAG TPA: prenyltransferase [Mycobacteriales bacterium]|nr:prenyltransferase [Mycobacteriales bacterium]